MSNNRLTPDVPVNTKSEQIEVRYCNSPPASLQARSQSTGAAAASPCRSRSPSICATNFGVLSGFDLISDVVLWLRCLPHLLSKDCRRTSLAKAPGTGEVATCGSELFWHEMMTHRVDLDCMVSNMIDLSSLKPSRRSCWPSILSNLVKVCCGKLVRNEYARSTNGHLN